MANRFPLIAAAIIMPSCAIVAGTSAYSVTQLHHSADRLSEAQIAEAYACGYRYGQVAITSRLPTLFTDPRDKEGPQGRCQDIKAAAAQHGFTG